LTKPGPKTGVKLGGRAGGKSRRRISPKQGAASQSAPVNAVHLVKLSVGSQSIDTLAAWDKKRVAHNKTSGFGAVHDHVTRMFPKRREALLNGGSIYWVIKGAVRARQAIVGLKSVTCADGFERCAILLDPPLIETNMQPRRAFHGWRYLEPQDAPDDLHQTKDAVQSALRADLEELGLL